MINKYEAVGVFACVGLMSLALFFLRVDTSMPLLSSLDSKTQRASVVVASDTESMPQSLSHSMNAFGDLAHIVVDDVVKGTGESVKKGDTVTVNYIGTLQDGQQFDNSYVKGTPFTFTVGDGKVIKGWDDGIVGMQKGGQRILVVPPEFAYGADAVGPIPAQATLVFAIELLEIN